MSFLFDQVRIKRQNIERVRQSFLLLTSDGQYPPERQLRLYQATIKLGLDWNEARQFMRPEAESFFQRYLAALAAQRDLIPEDTAELNRLRRRLALDRSFTDRLTASQDVQSTSLRANSQKTKHNSSSPPHTSVWSDIKAGATVVLIVPLIWLGLSLLTVFGLGIAGAIIGVSLANMLMPLAVLVNFFLSILIAVHRVRYWRHVSHSLSHPTQQPVDHKASPNMPSSRPGPALLLTGAILFNRTQNLSGGEFEQWVKDRLLELGWTDVRVMGGRGDRGVDIRGNYQGKRCIVQCKHYPGRNVPPNEVRALVGTRNIQRAQRAYLITSGQFGYQCFQEVYRKPVELWDLETLATHMNNNQMSMVA